MESVTSPRPARGWSFVGAGLAAAGLLCVFLGHRPGVTAPSTARPSEPRAQLEVPLTAAEVDAIVRRAAESVAGETMAVAVVDRRGAILAVWRRPAATEFLQEQALSLARTGAFFGHNQAPLTSRTIRFISGIHFPPGVRNQPNAELYGIENTNRVDRELNYLPGKEYPPPLNIDGTGPSLGITTGKLQPFDGDPRAVNPGGLPLYRADPTQILGIAQIGGVGVAGVPPDAAEFAAIQATGATLSIDTILRVAPRPKTVFIDGIALPLVKNQNRRRRPRGTAPGVFPGTGAYRVGPASGAAAEDGFLVGPVGNAQISAAEVAQIIDQCDVIARRTRAAIRLPIGSRARFIFAISGLDGEILGVFRQPDATVFSLDVATAKARNVVFYSDPGRDPAVMPELPVGTAVTNRTISFGAQPLFPPGINRSTPGPFFDIFLEDLAFPGGTSPTLPQPNIMRNGIVFFPGSAPLYRNGVLIGGLGVSGDGVAQDDFVTQIGSRGFHPPEEIRADNFQIRGVRLPYVKFPRNPTR